MRSILIHFRTEDEPAIRGCLDPMAQRTAEDEWQFPSATAPVIWCGITDCFDDWEPEDISALRTRMPGPSKFVQADVSGRIGKDEVQMLYSALLRAVPAAVVTDDYTNHPWTHAELEQGALIHGHPFFDTQGWYDDCAG